MAPIPEYVFLSYAKEDAPSADRLYRDLSSAGVSVWIDKHSLKPGENWKATVSRAIRNSSYFLALLSKRSMDKRGYVQRELREALDALQEVPESQVFIIPVRVEDCTPNNPRLGELQFIDLFPSYEDGFEKLKSFLIPTAAPNAIQPPVSGVRVVTRYDQRFGDEARQLLHGLATDREGHILVVGDFWGDIDFGGLNLRSAGDRDIFVAKFDKEGNHIWSKKYGDQLEQVGVGIGTDETGAVLIAGAFKGTLDFGGEPLVSGGVYNIALAKLDAAGNHIWSRSFGDDKYHVPECIAVAPSGLIAVTGRFQGSVNFGLGKIDSQSEQTDVFVSLFSPNGQCIWSKRIGGPFEQQARSLAIDAIGRVAVTGLFKGEMNFNGETIAVKQPTEYCGFLATFDERGNLLWCKAFGDPPVEQGSVVTFDQTNGDIVTGGFVRNKLPLDSSTNSTSVCLLARYSRTGLLRWSKTFGNHAFLDSLDVGPHGRILVTGHFSDSLDFGQGPLVSAGGYDVFAAIFTSDGNITWSKRFGDQWQQFLVKGAYGANGAIVLAGSFHGTIDFGRGPLIAAGYTGAQQGNEDVFLAILGDV